MAKIGSPDWTTAAKLLGQKADGSLVVLSATKEGVLLTTYKPHASTHEDGGSDEIVVDNLSGILKEFQKGKIDIVANKADFPAPGVNSRLAYALDEDMLYRDEANTWKKVGAQVGGTADVPLHASKHEDGGSDEIVVTGLLGDLADPQDPKLHATSHEDGGGDEISVAGLSGDLADPQDPKAHQSTHGIGGADEIADLATHSGRHGQGGADQVVGIVIQDTEANQPAAGIAGRFFLSTDTLKFWYDDGAAWNLIGVLAGLDLSSHSGRHGNGGADAITQLDTAENLSDLLPLDGGRDLTSILYFSGGVRVYGRDHTTAHGFVAGTDLYYHPAFWGIGKDHDTRAGDIEMRIGCRDAGYTPDSSFLIKYMADGSVSFIFEIDKNGNITNCGTILGVNIQNHSGRHGNGGADEISVAGLSGDLADAQDPKVHGNVDHSQNYGVAGLPGTQVYTGAAPDTWTDLDLSGEVGANKAKVFLKVYNNGASNFRFAVRKNGDTDFAFPIADYVRGTQLAMVIAGQAAYLSVVTDASGIIEWKSGGTPDTQIYLESWIRAG